MYYELWAIWQLSVTCHIQLSVIVVKLLWYCSYLVWLVFEGSIPTCACFQLKTFCDLFALFLFFFTSSTTTPQVERKQCTIFKYVLAHMQACIQKPETRLYKSGWWSHLVKKVSTRLSIVVKTDTRLSRSLSTVMARCIIAFERSHIVYTNTTSFLFKVW